MSKYHKVDLPDGQMTPAQKERLEEWHSQRIDQLLAEAWETDPAYRASVEVMERINDMDPEDVSDFEYMLAADVASWAALNFNESEWFEGLPANKTMLFNFTESQILPANRMVELAKSIDVLRKLDLWPWLQAY
jgi:hypothetical protein